MYRNSNGGHPLKPQPRRTGNTARKNGGGRTAAGEEEARRTNSAAAAGSTSSSTGQRTSNSWGLNSERTNKLLVFCDIVLKYVNYPNAFLDSEPQTSSNTGSEDGEPEGSRSVVDSKGPKNDRVAESPLNSVGESARGESLRSSTSSTESVITVNEMEQDDSMNKETFESITCWCGKPFAGRPMIECDLCLVWYHLKCENVKKNHIPNEFYCSRCRDKKKRRKRPSSGKDTSRKAKKANIKKRSPPATKLQRSETTSVSPPDVTFTITSAPDSEEDPPSPPALKASSAPAKPVNLVSYIPKRLVRPSSSSVTFTPVELPKKTQGVKTPTAANRLIRPKKLKVPSPSTSATVTASTAFTNGGSVSMYQKQGLTSPQVQPLSQMPPVLTCYSEPVEQTTTAPVHYASTASIPVLMPEVSTGMSSSAGHISYGDTNGTQTGHQLESEMWQPDEAGPSAYVDGPSFRPQILGRQTHQGFGNNTNGRM